MVSPAVHHTALTAVFAQDPPGESNVPNFVPRFIEYPVGADLTNLGGPTPKVKVHGQPASTLFLVKYPDADKKAAEAAAN